MRFEFKNQGVCSTKTIIDLDENNVIEKVEVVGGCDGNRKGLAAMLTGQKAEDVISRLEGIKCGFKSTSCPDQVAKALRSAISQNN